HEVAVADGHERKLFDRIPIQHAFHPERSFVSALQAQGYGGGDDDVCPAAFGVEALNRSGKRYHALKIDKKRHAKAPFDKRGDQKGEKIRLFFASLRYAHEAAFSFRPGFFSMQDCPAGNNNIETEEEPTPGR